MNKTAQPKAGKPETGEPETGQSEKPLQVLVVDDEPLARSRMRSLLGDCRNPRAELAAEAANTPDAMDLLVRQRDFIDGESWAVRLAGVDELLTISRRQVSAVRQALGQE